MNSFTSMAPPRMLRNRLPRVCVPVVAKNAAEMLEKAEQVARDNSFIEFRLDYLGTPALFLPKLKSFIEYHPHITLVATCRRAKAGGKFNGSIASEIDVLCKAAALGCHLVDVELETAVQLKTADWNKLRKHASIIVSFHDFRGTKKLDETFAKMEAFPADFIKMVTTANSLHDNVTMMKFLEKKGDGHAMVGVCMGEQGIISRVLAVRAGSVFTFGAANPGEETAPGQIAARTLLDTYRIEQVDAATRVYGVVGDPVSHSLSPAMMNTAFRRENLNAVYLALHAKTIGDLMQCVREIPIHGLSVTMPYKTDIMKYLDKTDAVTAKIGACNTVIRGADGKLYGFNTDVAGVIRPLEQRMAIAGSKFLVLGAGGAARAAVFGLKERGAEVWVMNRTASAAQNLAKQAKAKAIQKTQLAKLQFDAIINATSVGMKTEDKPLLSEKDLNTRYAFEMVYSHGDTKFTKMARAKGVHVIPGIEMFVNQGARQFEIWTGKPAPFDEMQRVVQHQLDLRAQAKK